MLIISVTAISFTPIVIASLSSESSSPAIYTTRVTFGLSLHVDIIFHLTKGYHNLDSRATRLGTLSDV